MPRGTRPPPRPSKHRHQLTLNAALTRRRFVPRWQQGERLLSVECDRITVITDPADALDQIAADTVAALRARPGHG